MYEILFYYPADSADDADLSEAKQTYLFAANAAQFCENQRNLRETFFLVLLAQFSIFHYQLSINYAFSFLLDELELF